MHMIDSDSKTMFIIRKNVGASFFRSAALSCLISINSSGCSQWASTRNHQSWPNPWDMRMIVPNGWTESQQTRGCAGHCFGRSILIHTHIRYMCLAGSLSTSLLCPTCWLYACYWGLAGCIQHRRCGIKLTVCTEQQCWVTARWSGIHSPLQTCN